MHAGGWMVVAKGRHLHVLRNAERVQSATRYSFICIERVEESRNTMHAIVGGKLSCCAVMLGGRVRDSLNIYGHRMATRQTTSGVLYNSTASALYATLKASNSKVNNG